MSRGAQSAAAPPRHRPPITSVSPDLSVYRPVAGPMKRKTIQPPMSTKQSAYACAQTRRQRQACSQRSTMVPQANPSAHCTAACVSRSTHNLAGPPQDALLAGPDNPRRLRRCHRARRYSRQHVSLLPYRRMRQARAARARGPHARSLSLMRSMMGTTLGLGFGKLALRTGSRVAAGFGSYDRKRRSMASTDASASSCAPRVARA